MTTERSRELERIAQTYIALARAAGVKYAIVALGDDTPDGHSHYVSLRLGPCLGVSGLLERTERIIATQWEGREVDTDGRPFGRGGSGATVTISSTGSGGNVFASGGGNGG